MQFLDNDLSLSQKFNTCPARLNSRASNKRDSSSTRVSTLETVLYRKVQYKYRTMVRQAKPSRASMLRSLLRPSVRCASTPRISRRFCSSANIDLVARASALNIKLTNTERSYLARMVDRQPLC